MIETKRTLKNNCEEFMGDIEKKLLSLGLVPPCVRIVVTSDEPGHRLGSPGASQAVAPAVSPLISIRGRRRLTCPIRICSKMR